MKGRHRAMRAESVGTRINQKTTSVFELSDNITKTDYLL